MSSTNLNTSPYKLIAIVVSVVVSLHALTAIALVMVASPEAKPETVDITPPIEIQLLTPLVPIEEIEEIEIENEPVKAVLEDQPQPTLKPKPKNKPQTAVSSPSQVIKEPKPNVRKDERQPKVNTRTTTDKGSTNQPLVDNHSKPVFDEGLNDAEKRKQLLAAQAHEKAMLQAQAARETEQARLQAEQNAQTKRDAQIAAAKAQAVKDAAERAAQAKAAAKEAAAKAEQAAAAQTASNEPVGYGNIGKSSWQKEPDFRFIKSKTYKFNRTQAELNVSVSMSVDARGQLHNIKIKKSSGDNQFDRDFVKALSNAKLHPATKNDKPIVSNATFPFRMIL